MKDSKSSFHRSGNGLALRKQGTPAGKRSLVQKRYGSATGLAGRRSTSAGPTVQAKADPSADSDTGAPTAILDAAKAQHATRRNPHWTRELGTTPADFGAPLLAVDSVAFAEHVAGLQRDATSLEVDGIAGPKTTEALSISAGGATGAAATTGRTVPETVSTPASVPVIITATKLRVRSRPDATSNDNILGTLDSGARVDAFGKEGSWLRIEFSGTNAYIHGAYTRPAEVEPPQDAPEAESPAGPGANAESSNIFDPLGLASLFTWLSDTVSDLLGGEDVGTNPEGDERDQVDDSTTAENDATEAKEPTGDPATLKDADLASLVDSLDHPYVAGMAQDLAALQDQAAALWKARSAGEEKGKGRDELVAGIAALRKKIAGLGGAGLEPNKRAQLEKLMYRAVHDLAPFYGQSINTDLLEGKTQAEELGTKTTVTTRTCNITSLAMALESLGKSPADYSGSQKKIDAVAKVFSSEVSSAKMKVGKSTAGLRMPDFMQLAAVAERLGSDTSAKGVNAAAVSAWEKILSIGFLKKLAARFGVNGSVKLFSNSTDATQEERKSQTAKLRSYGKKHRKITEKLVDARNKWEASGSEKDKKAYDKLKEKADAGLSGKGIEDDIGLEAYKNAVIEQIGAEMDAGSAVVVLLSGHYVRLQAIHDDHCVVDDPGRQSRSNRKVLWPEARAMGYFSYRLVLG